jgi:hypothetical protein
VLPNVKKGQIYDGLNVRLLILVANVLFLNLADNQTKQNKAKNKNI